MTTPQKATSRSRSRTAARRSDTGDAFIPESEQRTGTLDDLAEELAEQFGRSITTGEPDDNRSDDLEPEEIGGPFIESTGDREFGATRSTLAELDTGRNPLPEAVGGLVVASAEEEQQEFELQEDEQTGDVDHPEPDAEKPSQIVDGRDALLGAQSASRRR